MRKQAANSTFTEAKRSAWRRARGMLLVLAVCAVASGAQGAIPLAERQALIDLYETTNGGGWTNNHDWFDDPGAECYWEGVACDDVQTTVTALYLAMHNLVGHLPESPVDLTNLTQVEMSQNHLSGPIPPGIGNLTGLEYLYLNNNRLPGPVPPEAGNLATDPGAQ